MKFEHEKHLPIGPCQHTTERLDYANSNKPRTVQTLQEKIRFVSPVDDSDSGNLQKKRYMVNISGRGPYHENHKNIMDR